MEVLSVCRICLSTEASKDISDLKSHQTDEKTCSDIVLFCLGIQVEVESKISTKLCIKCFKKLMYFYNFKLLAIKNDAYFKNEDQYRFLSSINLHSQLKHVTDPHLEYWSNIKSETFLDEDLNDEELSIFDSDNNEIPLSPEIKVEPMKYEQEDPESCQSDDELLSEIRKVKKELVSEDNKAKKNEKNNLTTNRGKKSQKKKSALQVCAECGKSVKNLKEHVLRHERHRDVRKRLPCPLCEQTFSSYDARSKHKRLIHLGIKKPCPICKKMVKDLKSHNLNVHGKSKFRYGCVSCGKRFSCMSALDIHSSIHSAERPHACEVCDKKFRLASQLLSHKRQVHDKVRSRMCQFCSKAFAKENHLQRHLRIHTNEKPYQCKECGKAFNTDTSLKNHRFIHSDEKPFTCKICGKGFAAPGYLTNHMLTHTREKRFGCHYCDMKFHRSDHVKQHEVAVHKIKQLISAELK